MSDSNKHMGQTKTCSLHEAGDGEMGMSLYYPFCLTQSHQEDC